MRLRVCVCVMGGPVVCDWLCCCVYVCVRVFVIVVVVVVAGDGGIVDVGAGAAHVSSGWAK